MLTSKAIRLPSYPTIRPRPSGIESPQLLASLKTVPSPALVDRTGLIPQVKLDLHLHCYPQDRYLELFLLVGITRADHHLPGIVHSIEQHGHFLRPWSKRLRTFLNQIPELICRSFGLSHAYFVLQKPRRAGGLFGARDREIYPKVVSVFGFGCD